MKHALSLCGCLLVLACGSSQSEPGGGKSPGPKGGSGATDPGAAGAAADDPGGAGGGPDQTPTAGTSAAGDGSGGTTSAEAGSPGMGAAGTPAIECPAEGRYLPLVEGASWTYEVTDPAGGASEEKTSTVGALEDVGGTKAGVMAFHVITTKVGGSTESWQEDTGTAIRRHKELDLSGATFTEEYYEPYKLRVDESPEHTADGASWSESVSETVTDTVADMTTTSSKTEDWSVEAVDEVVTVPAGTFCTLRVRRVNAATGSDKTYWFARGVGKVRETGGSTEELVSYTLP